MLKILLLLRSCLHFSYVHNFQTKLGWQEDALLDTVYQHMKFEKWRTFPLVSNLTIEKWRAVPLVFNSDFEKWRVVPLID